MFLSCLVHIVGVFAHFIVKGAHCVIDDDGGGLICCSSLCGDTCDEVDDLLKCCLQNVAMLVLDDTCAVKVHPERVAQPM